jgi:hypothetical protein
MFALLKESLAVGAQKTGKSASDVGFNIHESILADYHCDICSKEMVKASGYAFNTTQVVTSFAYWHNLLKDQEKKNYPLLQNHGENYGSCVQTLSQSPSPWIVCETCAMHVGGDIGAAKSYGATSKQPKGTGPAKDRTAAAMAAAYGWSLAFDEWPSCMRVGGRPVVYDPSKGTQCHSCRRIVYGGENLVSMHKEAVELMLSNGINFVRTPSFVKVAGEDVYLCCTNCVDRLNLKGRGAEKQKTWWKFWK